MAEVALTSVIAACQWFMKQKQTNDEAIVCLRDMGDSIERMLPVLLSLNTQGLQDAPGVLENLWQCLENAKRIYLKYKKGYSIRIFWVTPACIKEKAEAQTKKVRAALDELLVLLNVVIHNRMVGGGMQANNIARQVRGVCAICRSPVFVDQERMKDQQGSYLHTHCYDMQQQQQPYAAAAAMQQPYAAMQQPYAAPAAASGTECDTCGIWEIPVCNIKMKLNRMGVPTEVLGKGSFGVVGLGFYTGSTKDGSVVNIPVAIKTALSNELVAAKEDSTRVRSFLNEVHFMCTLDHPNICDCYGAVTSQGGDLLLWIVMEKLHMSLHTAIMDKHVQHGRDAPGPFVEMLAGLLGALAYLHTDQRNPIVHRDLKPENVMLTSDNPPVAKLIDFGLAKETRDGVGSTFNKKGTPEWMAPEQKRQGGCTTASDVYAIGLVAQFMWCGRRPSDAQAPAHLVLTSEQTPHQLAAVTLSLMCQCLHPEARFRPRAAFVSHQLSILKASWDPPSSPNPYCGVSEGLSNLSLGKKDAVAEFFRNPPQVAGEERQEERRRVYSDQARLLASGSDDHTIRLWDPVSASSKRTLEGHRSDVNSVAFSADRTVIASGSDDNTVRLWDAVTGSCKCTLTVDSEVWSVAFAPDGSKIAAAYGHEIQIFDAQTKAKLGSPLSGHSKEVLSVCFSPDGQFVASGSADNTVKIWETSTGTCQSTLSGHSREVLSVCFSADGKKVASGSMDKTVKIWETSTGTCLSTLSGHSHWVLSVSLSPDSKFLASASKDKTVRIWDASTGQCQSPLSGHSGNVNAVTWSTT